MTSDPMSPAQDLLSRLHATAQAIRGLEAEAQTALHENGDQQAYRAKYLDKIILLQELPETLEPFLGKLPDATAARIAARAEGFANRASQAESVGSIFFMYALLYPDDYQDGQPNDLEAWIEELKTELG